MARRRKPVDPNAARDALLLDIAQRHLFLETLETRNRDRLDFHETAGQTLGHHGRQLIESCSGDCTDGDRIVVMATQDIDD